LAQYWQAEPCVSAHPVLLPPLLPPPPPLSLPPPPLVLPPPPPPPPLLPPLSGWAMLLSHIWTVALPLTALTLIRMPPSVNCWPAGRALTWYVRVPTMYLTCTWPRHRVFIVRSYPSLDRSDTK